MVISSKPSFSTESLFVDAASVELVADDEVAPFPVLFLSIGSVSQSSRFHKSSSSVVFFFVSAVDVVVVGDALTARDGDDLAASDGDALAAIGVGDSVATGDVAEVAGETGPHESQSSS